MRNLSLPRLEGSSWRCLPHHITALRVIREIDACQIVDSRPWDGDHIPDYSKLHARFKALLEAGCHDVLVDLGRDLFERGQVQVEEGRDEGQTHDAINGCLRIVYQALAANTH